MACTRFNYDDCRTKKKLQQSTDPGRWMLNVPGNGKMMYIEDPQIIPQKWGANLMTDPISLENELKGLNSPFEKDCINSKRKSLNSSHKINYSTNSIQFTEQSRATNPAWWYRDLEQVDWYYPPIDPQINTCIPFQNNICTRIIEKDKFNCK